MPNEREEQQFREFLFDFSEEYPGIKYKWLRLLLFDYVPLAELDCQHNTGMDLFNILLDQDNISTTNVTILLEIAKVTNQGSAISLVDNYIAANQSNVEQINGTEKLKHYRKQLFKALLQVIGQKELKIVTGFYKLNDFKFKSIWDVVFYLEKQLTLDIDVKEDRDSFAKRLNKKASSIFLEGEHLTAGSSSRQSDPDAMKPIMADLRADAQAGGAGPGVNAAEADFTSKAIDTKGGYLKLGKINLRIPSGAIARDIQVNMSLGQLIMDAKDIPFFNDLESRISPIVSCGPSGTVFKKHCSLSFPHNAVNEDSWEFTIFIRENSHSSWKRIEGDDKNTTYSVRNGRCYIRTNHFTYWFLGGTPIRIFYGEKTLKLRLFGKMRKENYYQLKVRIWSEHDYKLVQQEEREDNSKPLGHSIRINAKCKDMDISIDGLNDGWDVVNGQRNGTLDARLIWTTCPSHEFLLKSKDASIRSLTATISWRQGSNVRKVPVLDDECFITEPIMADLRADDQAGGAGPGVNAAKAANRAALEDDAAEEAGSSDTVVLRTKVPTRSEKKKFGDFLVKLSGYYSGIRVLWLRCLLFDHIRIGVLARSKIDGIGMFNELWDTGEISCNDVDLLSEIAELTKNKSAISHVTEYKTKTIKKHVPITKRKKLTQYRKNLFRALQLVEEDKLEFLANSYQQHYSDFINNIWDLVFFLEKDEQLEDKPDKVKRFGNLLNQKAKRAFLDGLVTTSRKRKDGLDRGDDTPSKRKKGEQSTMSSSSNSEDADSSDDSNLG